MRRTTLGMLGAAAILVARAATAMAAPGGPDPTVDLRLLEAVKSGDRTSASALLKQHADAKAAEPDGTTVLHWAVRLDDRDLATQLLRSGADPKAANRYGVTPLYLACVNGSAPMIEALLKAGADANQTAPEGETALMTAARTGSMAAANMLLAHGAVVDAREEWRGQTALMWAAAQNHPAMVSALLAHGADVNARSTAREWERQRTAEPREKWLPPGGLTPLLFAARQGALDSLRVLVDAGADVNAVSPDGISGVVSAIINGHFDVAGFLVEKGTDPNLADVAGRTALFSAADMSTVPASNRPAPKVIENRLTAVDLMTVLLAHGADINTQLKTQQPYRTKLDRGDDTMLTTGTTPLLRAARASDVPAVRLLLSKGADPRLATRAGITPLMAAAGLGTKEEDTVGRSKTQAATIETIDMLLKSGVDINAADGRGQTALHGAALQGYDDVVRFLASRGAALGTKDKAGLTALDAAMGRGAGVGFDGQSANPHETTAALLRQLASASGPTR